jgi:hypothetical protein
MRGRVITRGRAREAPLLDDVLVLLFNPAQLAATRRLFHG